MDNTYLTVEETAALLRVTPETVRSYIARKKDPLPAVRLGREYRILKTDLDQWLRQRKNTQET